VEANDERSQRWNADSAFRNSRNRRWSKAGSGGWLLVAASRWMGRRDYCKRSFSTRGRGHSNSLDGNSRVRTGGRVNYGSSSGCRSGVMTTPERKCACVRHRCRQTDIRCGHWPSIQPSSRSRVENWSRSSLSSELLSALYEMMPICRTRVVGCCARAASGQAAVPQSPAMKSRRRISASQKFVGKPIAIRDALEPVLMTASGPFRSPRLSRLMSAKLG
jgi:hypothetical protein